MMTCSLGDDGVPSYENTCSFTCSTGYELTGSETRTCQSNGSWSGSEAICRRGMSIVFDGNLFNLFLSVRCPIPDGAVLTMCLLGDDGVPSYEDTCSFTCNTGYVLSSNGSRTCQSDQSWSGGDDVCRRGVLYIGTCNDN